MSEEPLKLILARRNMQRAVLKIELASVDDTTEHGPLYDEMTEAARQLVKAEEAMAARVAEVKARYNIPQCEERQS